MNTATPLMRRGLGTLIPLAVLLLLLAGLWIIYQTELSYNREQRRALEVQAEILAAGVTAALDFGDQMAAQESVHALQVNPQIRTTAVYDAKGNQFAGVARTGAPLPAHLPAAGAPSRTRIQAIVPVMQGTTRIGTVYLAGAIDPLSRRLSRYAIVALLVVMTSLVLVALGYGQAALGRVNRTLAQANRELQVQIEERARTEEQLREAQKMQALGQLTGGIAHDFNNLLAVIHGSADMLQRPGLSEEKRLRFSNAILDASTHAALLTGQLLAFARRQPLKPLLLDINQRVTTMLVMLQPTLGPNITLSTHLQDDLPPVEVDPGQFEAALLNIVVNARDAMPDGGEIVIHTNSIVDGTADEPRRTVAVAVEDQGCGIAPDRIGHVFEPFFTTKGVGKGTGLGLSQVHGFAAQSGGAARVDSEVGKGTTLTILLPASDKHLPVPRADAPVETRETPGRILLVEDNEEVGNLAETLLGELGHAVIRARNGPEALRLTDSGAQFDLVFSDVVMPGMSGLELAGELKQRHPLMPIILTTGYSDHIAATGSQGCPVIHKPYRMEALAIAVDEALAVQRAGPHA